MINDPAESSFTLEIGSEENKSPRQTTIDFIRQFARIYMDYDDRNRCIGGIVANSICSLGICKAG